MSSFTFRQMTSSVEENKEKYDEFVCLLKMILNPVPAIDKNTDSHTRLFHDRVVLREGAYWDGNEPIFPVNSPIMVANRGALFFE